MHTTRASLLLRLRQPSDQAAWSEFDGIYRSLLMRFVQAKGLGHADAEDVVQYCLTTVQQRIGVFEYDPDKGRFKNWLFTVASNRIRNLARCRRDQRADTAVLAFAADTNPTPE